MNPSDTNDDSALQAGGSETADAGGEDLATRLAQAEAKAGEHWDLYLRARAELENQQRRMARELENAHKYGLERFVNELLPVRDSLELGLAASAAEHADQGALREGMALTLKMLTAALEKAGVREIAPAGEPFDPQWHAAVSMQESAEAPENTVLEVMQKGYALNDRLIRPAMVVVARAPAG
jgi:molecular chaperone GrpE